MRPARLLTALGLAALAAAAGHAQELLTVRGGAGGATSRPPASGPATSKAAAATVPAGSGFGPFAAPTWEVDVDLDLVRSAPRRLVLPAPDGRPLTAELTVFEDRGAGDALWSGRFPGAEYDSVVLTIEGGRLAGRFDEPAGAQFRIGAGDGGDGTMVGERSAHGDERHFCPVGSPGHESARLVHAAPAAAAAPERVGGAASDGRLDILILYTAEAARKWAALGGAQASIRNAVDYLNMVLRNGRIDLQARAVHIAQAPDVLDRVGRDGVTAFGRNLLARLRANGEAAALRIRHKADIVHLFTGEPPPLLGSSGSAGLLKRGDSAASFSPNAYGFTAIDHLTAKTFAHEVGHNLGANHAPHNAGPPGEAVTPYAFGHVYATRTVEHGTAMTYAAHVEPWFSSTRIAPAGYRIGIAGQRDNERALRETAAIASRFGDSLVTPGTPNAPSDVRAEALNGSTMRVSWSDNSNDEGGFEIRVARFGSAPHNRRRTAANVRSVDLNRLESGVHVVTVYAFNEKGLSPLGGGVDVTLPGWRPEAPTNVRVTAASEAEAEVSWSHDDYVPYEIHALRDGEVWGRTWVLAGSRSGRVPVEPGAHYGFRVYAYTILGGRSAPSRTVSRNFQGGDDGAGIAAPTDFRATILDATTVRLDWTDNASNETAYRTTASRWDWSSTDAHGPNRNSHVYKALRPGEIYRATLTVYGGDGSQTTVETGFALPASSGGPAAPSNLAYDAASGRLTWSDNSSNEEGFELQYRVPPEISLWRRLGMLPAGAESFARRDRYGWDYRVVAWNAAGVSASEAVRLKPPPEPPPQPPPGPPTTTGFAARPAGASAVELTWTDEWAAPSRGTLAIEARTFRRPAWQQVASAPATTGSARVSGLDRDTPYTFRLRSGAEASGNASATTGDPVGDCRSGQRYLCLRQKRFEVRVHWSNPDNAGDNGAGAAVPVAISDESGLFWFFDPDNIELAVKVLDGRGVNGAFWVFFGALTDVEYWLTVEDTEGGGRRTYHNPPKTTCGQSDVAAFAAGASASGVAASGATASGSSVTGAPASEATPNAAAGGPASWASGTPASGRAPAAPGIDLLRLQAAPLDLGTVEAAANGGGSCEPGDETLCLLDGRFAVEVRFVDPNAGPAAARVIPSLTTAKTGFFWFFSPSNIELATKLLDGRPINGRFWFLYGGLSDVEYEIVVTDTTTGDVKPYRNEAGSLCGQIDTEAL